MGTKGRRSQRDKGEIYDEPKKQQVLILLTKTGRRLLNEKIRSYRDAEGQQLSRSEYFERWARDLL